VLRNKDVDPVEKAKKILSYRDSHLIISVTKDKNGELSWSWIEWLWYESCRTHIVYGAEYYIENEGNVRWQS